MTEVLNLAGYIKGITYQTFLEDELEVIDLNNNDKLNSFISKNSFKKGQKEIIKKLALEAKNNKNLKIEISSNY